LSKTGTLNVIHSIVTCSLLYIAQDFPFIVIIFLTISTTASHGCTTPQPSVVESEWSRTTGTSSNAPLAETQQQHRHVSVHRNGAIAATKNMTQVVYLIIVPETGLSNPKKQQAMICKLLHIEVNGGQLTS